MAVNKSQLPSELQSNKKRTITVKLSARRYVRGQRTQLWVFAWCRAFHSGVDCDTPY